MDLLSEVLFSTSRARVYEKRE